MNGGNGTSEQGTEKDSSEWWMNVCKKEGLDKIKKVDHGFKVVLLLHILAYAEQLGDKVLIFCLGLSTMDYLEEVLALPDWKEHVPGLNGKFPAKKLGGWQKSKPLKEKQSHPLHLCPYVHLLTIHYYFSTLLFAVDRDFFRVDGATASSERGDLITNFNDSREGARAFLLSSRAGGIGINLAAANRVVLFDCHFNPTIAQQSVFRAYRYGQTKKVFCYRFITEGTMEEKVYSRTVNKTGLALRIIDRKTIERSFSAQELNDLKKNDTWVQCDYCEKWRMLIGDVKEEDIPEKWYCRMNKSDPLNNACTISEKTQSWYAMQYPPVDPKKPANKPTVVGVAASPAKFMTDEELSKPALSDETTQRLTSKDEILQHLLTITETGKKSNIISRHYFHEALLESKGNLGETPESPKTSNTKAPASAVSPQNASTELSVPNPLLKTNHALSDSTQSKSVKEIDDLIDASLITGTPGTSLSLKSAEEITSVSAALPKGVSKPQDFLAGMKRKALNHLAELLPRKKTVLGNAFCSTSNDKENTSSSSGSEYSVRSKTAQLQLVNNKSSKHCQLLQGDISGKSKELTPNTSQKGKKRIAPIFLQSTFSGDTTKKSMPALLNSLTKESSSPTTLSNGGDLNNEANVSKQSSRLVPTQDLLPANLKNGYAAKEPIELLSSEDEQEEATPSSHGNNFDSNYDKIESVRVPQCSDVEI